MAGQPPEYASGYAPADAKAATDTDRFAAIHDACRHVRADVTANVARAYQIRAHASQLRRRASQLRAVAGQLAQAQ
jgi:hypothetical protein